MWPRWHVLVGSSSSSRVATIWTRWARVSSRRFARLTAILSRTLAVLATILTTPDSRPQHHDARTHVVYPRIVMSTGRRSHITHHASRITHYETTQEAIILWKTESLP